MIEPVCVLRKKTNRKKRDHAREVITEKVKSWRQERVGSRPQAEDLVFEKY